MSDMRKSRPQAGKVHSKASRAILASMVAAFMAPKGPVPGVELLEPETPAPGKKQRRSSKNYQPGQRPSTMPKNPQTGEAISKDRRRRREIKALFLEDNGRRMNRKDFKRERRLAKLELPQALEQTRSMSALFMFRGG